MPARTEITAQKSEMRQRMIAARARIPARTAKRAAQEISRQFMGSIPVKKWDIIGGYWPMTGEVDTVMLLEALAEQGHKVTLPVAKKRGEPLIFREWRPGLPLIRNPELKIQEPPKGAQELTPTLLIVPLLAFDAAGYRLGFGAGFYDRTLAALAGKPLFTVGLAYARQQVGYVPREPHDHPLDCIITEKRALITAES